jgi:hypothetical protein
MVIAYIYRFHVWFMTCTSPGIRVVFDVHHGEEESKRAPTYDKAPKQRRLVDGYNQIRHGAY